MKNWVVPEISQKMGLSRASFCQILSIFDDFSKSLWKIIKYIWQKMKKTLLNLPCLFLYGTSKPETWVKPSGFWVSDLSLLLYPQNHWPCYWNFQLSNCKAEGRSKVRPKNTILGGPGVQIDNVCMMTSKAKINIFGILFVHSTGPFGLSSSIQIFFKKHCFLALRGKHCGFVRLHFFVAF